MAESLDDIFGTLMQEIKRKDKADKAIKTAKPGSKEFQEANAIRQAWIETEWEETAFGPMFLRQCCTNCGNMQQQFAGFFAESRHLTKRDTTRLVRIDDLSVAREGDLQSVRFFREEDVSFCAAPGCITGFDNAPWRR